jgi:hypothetical protein
MVGWAQVHDGSDEGANWADKHNVDKGWGLKNVTE